MRITIQHHECLIAWLWTPYVLKVFQNELENSELTLTESMHEKTLRNGVDA